MIQKTFFKYMFSSDVITTNHVHTYFSYSLKTCCRYQMAPRLFGNIAVFVFVLFFANNTLCVLADNDLDYPGQLPLRLTFMITGECDPFNIQRLAPCINAGSIMVFDIKIPSGYFEFVLRRNYMNPPATNIHIENVFSMNTYTINIGNSHNLRKGDQVSICSLGNTGQDCSPCYGKNMTWSLVSNSCECFAGYGRQANTTDGEMICNACKPGYNSSTGYCTCDTNMYDDSDSGFCECLAGYEPEYTIDGGEMTCNLCKNNFYKVTEGSTPCMRGCYAGYGYDIFTETCTQCSVGYSKQTAGIKQCIEGCDALYEYKDGFCQKCIFGYEKQFPGPDLCKVERKECEESESDDLCWCNDGFEHNEEFDDCVRCPPDYVKPSPGIEACTKCALGFHTPKAGPQVCICDAAKNHYMDVESGFCPCVEGYEFDFNFDCTSCPADYEKISPGMQACTKCALGFEKPEVGPHVCICDIATNHVIDIESGLCGCIVGYGYDNKSGNCSLCSPDYGKPNPGIQTCTKCALGFHTPEVGPRVCTCNATKNHYLDMESGFCGCKAGYEFDFNFDCLLCPVDYGKPIPGNQTCTKCAIGFHTPEVGSRVCICDATKNHYLDLESGFCGCNEGYEYDSNFDCLLCPADYEKTSPGNQACTKCALGFEKPEVGPHVCICNVTKNHVIDIESGLCGCIAGYEFDSDFNCKLCLPDYEKKISGIDMCILKCRVDTFGELYNCDTPSHLAYSTFSSVSVGLSHTCAIRLPQRDVNCWPESHPAAKHTPNFIRDATALSLGELHSCAVWGPKKTLTCWGKDVVEQDIVNVTTGVRMLAVGSPDSRHTCFLREGNSDIACIGDNRHGQLGLGEFGETVENVAADFIL